MGGPMGGPGMGGPMGGPGMGGPMGGPGMGGPMGGPPMGAPMGAPMGSPIGTQSNISGGNNAVKLVAVGALVLGVIGLIAFGVNYAYSHPSLYIVNTTGADGLTVSIDGEPLASDIKFAPKEDQAAVAKESIKSGVHKVETKDSSGKVIDSFTYDFNSGFGTTYVYAPARNKQICFFIQTDEYKTDVAAPDTVNDRFKPLDPTKTLWEVPESIDYWFQDSPESVEIKTKKGQKAKESVVKRALRQGACNDPEFQG